MWRAGFIFSTIKHRTPKSFLGPLASAIKPKLYIFFGVLRTAYTRISFTVQSNFHTTRAAFSRAYIPSVQLFRPTRFFRAHKYTLLHAHTTYKVWKTNGADTFLTATIHPWRLASAKIAKILSFSTLYNFVVFRLKYTTNWIRRVVIVSRLTRGFRTNAEQNVSFFPVVPLRLAPEFFLALFEMLLKTQVKLTLFSQTSPRHSTR